MSENHAVTGLGNVPVTRWEDKKCEVHKYHSPRPEFVERHHILPLAWGGSDSSSNVAMVCPTGHTNVHYLLAQYKKYDGEVPHDILRSFGHAERALAKRGWEARP